MCAEKCVSLGKLQGMIALTVQEQCSSLIVRSHALQ